MQIKTINLQGKQYAPVSERLNAFNTDFKDSSIETSYNFQEGWCIFKAKVTPDVKKPERVAIAHSMGKVSAVKALEKLETVAVGRALAFLGYATDGSIATYEEMVKFNETDDGDK